MIKNNRSLRRKVTNKNILHVVKYFNVTFPFKNNRSFNDLLFLLVFIDNGYVMFFTLDNNVPERRDVDMFLTFFKNFLKFL